MTSRPIFVPLLLLAASGCIVETTDDDDTGAGPATSSASASSTTDAATSTTQAEEETGAMDTSGTSGPADGSSGVISGTGDYVPDCSMCNAEVEPDPLCHSSFNAATGQCECDAGYIFESTDPDDFTCVREEVRPGECGDDPNSAVDQNGDCVCLEGFEWCSDDPSDLTCCAI